MFKAGDLVKLKLPNFSGWNGLKAQILGRDGGYWSTYVFDKRGKFCFTDRELTLDTPLSPFEQSIQDYINQELPR